MTSFDRYVRVKELVAKRTRRKNHWSADEVDTMILEVLLRVAEEEVDFLAEMEKRLTRPN